MTDLVILYATQPALQIWHVLQESLHLFQRDRRLVQEFLHSIKSLLKMTENVELRKVLFVRCFKLRSMAHRLSVNGLPIHSFSTLLPIFVFV